MHHKLDSYGLSNSTEAITRAKNASTALKTMEKANSSLSNTVKKPRLSLPPLQFEHAPVGAAMGRTQIDAHALRVHIKK